MVKYTPELVKEIGNAIAAYGVILSYASLGMDVPVQFEKFKDLSDEDLHRRMKLLKDFYEEITNG
jgi:hypothetical protein